MPYYGEWCHDVFVGSCAPDPATILAQDTGISAGDCQMLCGGFSHCTNFRHQKAEDTCTLFTKGGFEGIPAGGYRPGTCTTWAGPSSPGAESNFDCFKFFIDEYQTCDDFWDEDCTMSSQPELTNSTAAGALNCADFCSSKELPFYVHDGIEGALGEGICQCFSSSARTCSGLGGPPLPPIQACMDLALTRPHGVEMAKPPSMDPASLADLLAAAQDSRKVLYWQIPQI